VEVVEPQKYRSLVSDPVASNALFVSSRILLRYIVSPAVFEVKLQATIVPKFEFAFAKNSPAFKVPPR
jgi:hypothetical protein